MRPLAFNTRLALGGALLVLVSLALFATASLLFFRYEQFEQVDLELHSTLAEPLDNQGLPESPPPYVSVARIDENGKILASTERFPVDLVPLALAHKGPLNVNSPAPGWRLLAGGDQNGALIAAYDLYEVRDVTLDMLQACLLALPLLAALAGAAVWWFSHRALRPLRELTAATSGVAALRLDQRVPVPPADDDLQRLALAFNAMLARLETGFEQARRFSADASHELRTPLTIMRGEISRLLRNPGLAAQTETALLSLQEEIGRLERITEHLLLLARLDAGQIGAELFEEIDFAALVAAACEDAELLAGARDVSLQVAPAPAARVRGDALLLRRVVLNLLDNATRYNRPGGEVACALSLVGDRVELSVRNTGDAISPEARAGLFRRFYRADAARGRGGHGLGLALSREIARSHGGELSLRPDPAPGLTEFLLTLPALPAKPAS